MAAIINTRDNILRVSVPRFTSADYQSQIDVINSTLADIASDGKFTTAERQAIRKEWDIVISERQSSATSGLMYLDNLYPAVATESTAYTTAFQTLATYLNAGAAYTIPALGTIPTPPSWLNDASLAASTSITIVSSTFRANWKAMYDARTALINKAATEAGKVAVWTGVTSRPVSYRVVSTGFSATTAPATAGIYNAESSALLSGPASMYRVCKINRGTGTLTVVGGYNPAVSAEMTAMAVALNAIQSDHIVVVFGYDNPATNRTINGVQAAMERCGASKAIFGSTNFKYRAAYILIGIAGCGESNGFESYQGTIASDTNAWCDVFFTVYNGNLQVTGTSTTPKSLVDYGYSGDLNATYGADWLSEIQNRPSDAELLNNLMDTSWWEAGNLQTQWGSNNYSNGSVTDFITAIGPTGVSETVMRATAGPAASTGGGGGWNPGGTGNSFYVRKDRTYQFSCYFYRAATGSVAGSAWWGIEPNTVCDLNSTTVVGNPYFHNGSDLIEGRWYLAVGKVYPYGSTGNSSIGSGFWDCSTGKLVSQGLSFNWASTAGTLGTRAYLFYANSAVLYFTKPMVRLCNGSEPTIEALVAAGNISGRNRIPVGSPTTFIDAGAITANVRNFYNNSYLYNGAAIANISATFYSPFITTVSANSRLCGNISGNIYVLTGGSTNKYIRLRATMGIQNSGNVTQQAFDIPGATIKNDEGANSYTELPLGGQLIFDSVAVGTYRVLVTIALYSEGLGPGDGPYAIMTSAFSYNNITILEYKV